MHQGGFLKAKIHQIVGERTCLREGDYGEVSILNNLDFGNLYIAVVIVDDADITVDTGAGGSDFSPTVTESAVSG